MRIRGHDVYLGDDGTLDTIIVVDGKDYRFNTDEDYSNYRDANGCMTDEGFAELADQAITIHEEDENNG